MHFLNLGLEVKFDMDLSKSYEFLQPDKVRDRIHIIGCGAIGSTVGELLAKAGFTKITLWDFDHVESHNIANQMYTELDIGKAKVDALAERMSAINPELKQTGNLKLEKNGWDGQRLTGFVFLCVDNIDLRRRIATENKDNMMIRGMFDFRMRLTDAQHYAADWKERKMVEAFLNSMNFTQEEGKAETPVSACNIELSFASTVFTIVAAGVSNFVNFVKGLGLKKMIIADAFSFDLLAM